MCDVDDVGCFFVLGQEVCIVGYEMVCVVLGKLGECVGCGIVLLDFVEMGIVVDVFVQCDFVMGIDGDVVQYLLIFVVVEQQFDGVVEFGV